MPTRPAKAAKTPRPAAKAAQPAKKTAKKATKKATPAAKPAGRAKASGNRVPANFYELRSGRSRITYTESNIAGEPVLTYKDLKRDLTFTGDEIQQDPQQIGLLLTVVLAFAPDGFSDLLTVLIPRVNLTNGEGKVKTEAIFTRVKDSIGGPNLVSGQVQSYTTKTFTGTAQFIVT
jgi:hypothetical protein